MTWAWKRSPFKMTWMNRINYLPPKTNMYPAKMVVGRLLSFWNGSFVGDMVVFRGVKSYRRWAMFFSIVGSSVFLREKIIETRKVLLLVEGFCLNPIFFHLLLFIVSSFLLIESFSHSAFRKRRSKKRFFRERSLKNQQLHSLKLTKTPLKLALGHPKTKWLIFQPLGFSGVFTRC